MGIRQRGIRVAAAIWRPAAELLTGLWQALLAVLEGVVRCWFIVAVLAAAALVLTHVPQGREAIFADLEQPAGPFRLYLAIVTVGGALATLFASMLLAPGGPVRVPGTASAYAAYHVPGLIGLVSVFLVPCLLEMYLEGHPAMLDGRREVMTWLGRVTQFAGGMIIPVIRHQALPDLLERLADGRLGRADFRAAAGFLVLIVLNIILFLAGLSLLWSAVILWAAIALTDLFSWESGLAPEVSSTRKYVGICFALMILALGLFLAAGPVSRAPYVGPAAVLLLAVNFWLAVGLLATFACRRLPWILGVLAFLGALWSCATGPFDQWPVRLLPPQGTVLRHVPSGLDVHARSWLEHRRGAIEAAGRYPVVLVTAEGGGIRAAYWTAAVLAALQDADPRFASHVFAVSGVSGGSLGAAVFAALVKGRAAGTISSCSQPAVEAGPLERCASRVLGHDFLSAPMAAMLISDALRSALRRDWFADRAVVLEEAFEAAWRNITGTTAFQEDFQALWDGEAPGPPVPSLFLNGTDADTGERLVMSNVSLGSGSGGPADLAVLLRPDSVRLSTAVMMSARFPLISPAGIFRNAATGAQVRVVDGGYFDNSGAATAADVLSGLKAAADALGLSDRILPVVVLIANDPGGTELAAGATAPVRAGAGISPLAAMVVPVSTLDRVRQGLADRFKAELGRRTRDLRGEVLEGFRLRGDRVDFPLGWMLSGEARLAMHGQIRAAKNDPGSDFSRLLQLLDQKE